MLLNAFNGQMTKPMNWCVKWPHDSMRSHHGSSESMKSSIKPLKLRSFSSIICQSVYRCIPLFGRVLIVRCVRRLSHHQCTTIQSNCNGFRQRFDSAPVQFIIHEFTIHLIFHLQSILKWNISRMSKCGISSKIKYSFIVVIKYQFKVGFVSSEHQMNCGGSVLHRHS